jgi:hypothetical protein
MSVCGLYCLKRMDVLMWKSAMASRIVFLSYSSAQEKGVCQFLTEYFATPKTLKVPLCNLGNKRPGQKVPGIISVGAESRYCAAQGRTLNRRFNLVAMRRLHDEFRRNGQEIAVCCVANDNVPCTWSNVCSRCWQNNTFNRCVSHKTATHGCVRSFSCFLAYIPLEIDIRGYHKYCFFSVWGYKIVGDIEECKSMLAGRFTMHFSRHLGKCAKMNYIEYLAP